MLNIKFKWVHTLEMNEYGIQTYVEHRWRIGQYIISVIGELYFNFKPKRHKHDGNIIVVIVVIVVDDANDGCWAITHSMKYTYTDKHIRWMHVKKVESRKSLNRVYIRCTHTRKLFRYFYFMWRGAWVSFDIFAFIRWVSRKHLIEMH